MAEETTNWDYKPDQGAEQTKGSSSVLKWTASEYIDHKQGAGWFSLLALATIALASGVYLVTRDYFATGTMAILGIIVGIFAHRTPRELNYELSADGLKIENKLYPLNQFKSFSIIQEGPICSLEFMPLKKFMPPISAFFALADQNKIVSVLEHYLPYEERQLEAIEKLSRRLRF